MERITDCNGKRFSVREFHQDDIVEYKKHLLSDCASESFLPMHFIASVDGITAYYGIDGFVSIEEWFSRQDWLCEEPASTLCSMFSMILRRMIEAEDLFLDLNDLILNLDTVFVHAKERHIKLAYQSRAGTHQALQNSFLELMKSITEIVNDEQWTAYSEEIQRQAMEENLGLTGILKRITEQSRCILERKWPEREHFRV